MRATTTGTPLDAVRDGASAPIAAPTGTDTAESPGHGPAALEDYTRLAREGLLRACRAAAEAPDAAGMPGTLAEGQLIRPLTALAGASHPHAPPEGFWSGVLAIQLAHEASLVHDDVVDEAVERRGRATALAAEGVGRALLLGDHLLTAAYRAAANTGSLAFASLFARAVERTVAGETLQGRSGGRQLEQSEYEAIALGKAGELLGCALALAPLLEGRGDAPAVFELGRRVGLFYQRLDDLLDYCPSTETGKPPLGDFGRRRWTWVLEECPDLDLDAEPEKALLLLHGPRGSGSPMRRCVHRLEQDAAALRTAIAARLPSDPLLGELLDRWVATARAAADREAHEVACRLGADALRRRIPTLVGAEGYLAEHSRSFRFASRLFAAEDADRVARVYAFCRVTDDLVDRPGEGDDAEVLLECWLELSRRAYGGRATGLPLLDRVMAEMAAGGVPFDYAEALVEGMRMDLRGGRYRSLAELRRYTFRVASVVGLWMTRLFGVHDPRILAQAERMGHAMQLTNILRDVGDDWSRGRLYLPLDIMLRHGVTEAELDRMWCGAPITPGYRSIIEDLMRVADADYAAALAAIPALPPSLGRPVAVAAEIYRGIHQEIRENGYDNLRLRAYTSTATKGALAARALWGLRRGSRGESGGESEVEVTGSGSRTG